ncbi:hypothetical protein BSL78_04804 [Apostichopus japonicus]|uniref:Integrase core domain-containing protein n=1 Tax=Stichopus japonicus TaxID=307972 RepID=A0A2G8LDF6_STIJA|nr:hypothetical protein BSL78_04804 [Apostichopus japonicus]
MAKLFRCSTSTINKLCLENNLKMRDRYSNISEEELRTWVSRLHNQHPNSGAQMMMGYLKANGIVVPRKKVRDLLRTVDPVGTGRRWGAAVARRTYSVPCTNSLWHIDAHQKLVRWGFHTHGCIDGFSRLVPYLACETVCDANTVLRHFVNAIKDYGVPSRVRSDYGGENIDVALLMNSLRGLSRGSHLTGESVHNERIQRLWRDVHKDVTSLFYEELYSLEDDLLLDVANPLEKFSVQLVYLPIINEHLDSFRKGWNCHAIRTENHRTPEQLWFEGVLTKADSSHTAINELFENQHSLESRIEESVPLIVGPNSGNRRMNNSPPFEISEEQILHLREEISNTQGRKEKYIKCATILKEMLENN